MSGGFLVCYLIAFSLLIAAALYFARVHVLKFAAVGMLMFITSATYFCFENYKGWPSGSPYPTGRLVWVDARKPDILGGDKGAVFLWVSAAQKIESTWFAYAPQFTTPRVYEVPYNDETEKAMGGARQAIREGYYVFIQSEADRLEAAKKKEEDDKKKGKTKNKAFGDAPDSYNAPHLKIVPPEEMAPKG